ncbi:MAG: NADP-dependent isocitrate dehydrogenase, partial [Acidimicrobiales bacterium]
MATVTPDPKSTIWYTYTDEAPALALLSLLPILRSYAAHAGVFFQTKDISLAGRILAAFSDTFPVEQRVENALATLGQMVKEPEANIIKLPNISASIPQLEAAIAELRREGYELPPFPHEPAADEEREIAARYRRVLGSAVNPVLRQGNSDRRAPASVKQYAQLHPHRMGSWSATSKTNVAHMEEGDFRHSEESITIDQPGALTIEFVSVNGESRSLRDPIPVLAGEIVDASVMKAEALRSFLEAQVRRAKEESVLFSLHLKATMMKVSDPIIFGHGVRAFFPATFSRYGERIHELGLSPENGLGSIFAGLSSAPDGEEIRASFDREMEEGPALAMVDSARGITNLHVPSDVIVDASMPAMIRTSGHMWGPDGNEADVLAVIPDSSYAGIYQVVIDDCREHGAYDPATMGSVSNVGLMAQAAEEYGSHD